MNAQDKAQALVDYWLSSRNAGHTRVLIKGARNDDCYVVGHNHAQASVLAKEAEQPPENALTIHAVHNRRGHQKPLAIDHSVFQFLLPDLLDEISRQDETIRKQRNEIRNLQNTVERLKRL